MKRRNLLKLMGFGAVAAPAAAAQAATSAGSLLGSAIGLESLMLPGVSSTPSQGDSPYMQMPGDKHSWALKRLAKLATKTAFDRHREERMTGVDNLDPDLVVMHSMALHCKIEIQRKRNYQKTTANEIDWLNRHLLDVDDD